MNIHFLGTAGGHRAMGEQLRKTVGTIIEGTEASIYLDPGPGSLIECQDYRTSNLEGVIVTHCHLDHYSDAEALIEKISLLEDNACTLLAPETVVQGYGDMEKSVSSYHQQICTDVINLSENESAEVSGLRIETQEMFHNEPKTRGLKVSENGEKIGFWTDTKFVEELTDFYSDCETIVINCFFPRGVNSRKHTTVSDIPKILEDLEASTVILTHFGEQFLESDMVKEKAWIEERVNQKVVFAEDGMTFPGDRKLTSF